MGMKKSIMHAAATDRADASLFWKSYLTLISGCTPTEVCASTGMAVAQPHEGRRMPKSGGIVQLTYPQSDGQPMADNTTQFRLIVTIQGGLDALFREDSQVFVAGDLLWYPVEGHPEICMAPDVLVAFGRPKGDRGSYLQWEEGDIAPQVVFEIRSPGNSIAMMLRKFRFYERYGVVEYYLYDPGTGELSGWQRQGEALEEIEHMAGWVSPRLGIRFELESGVLQVYQPDGERFATYVEIIEQRAQERQRAEQERQRAERLAARLRALGVELEDA
jgi:Uma2 family endonuclease